MFLIQVHGPGVKSSVWIAGLAVAIALGAAPVAQAGQGGVVSRPLIQDQGAVRAYWTPERMRNAIPLDGPAAGEFPGDSLARAAAQPPDQEIDPSLDVTYPYRIHGRLFLTFGASNASCSGTVVTSRSRDVILTAGHCVAEPVGLGSTLFARNVIFVPGYRNGDAPLGSYVGTRGGTPGQWAALGDVSFDVGVINLAPLNGGLIQDQLGSRGVGFNRIPGSFNKKTFQLFGYPAAPAGVYDGERPILCNSRFRGFERFSGALVASPCHQQEGASGGGWVLGGLVTSITSHSGCSNPGPSCDLIAGTYLGSSAFRVYRQANGGLPKGTQKQIKRCKRFKGKQHDKCLSKAETFRPVVR
jgi:hypothetical protein